MPSNSMHFRRLQVTLALLDTPIPVLACWHQCTVGPYQYVLALYLGYPGKLEFNAS